MTISDKDFIILRYLQWSGPLFGHPDYLRAFSRKSAQVINGRGTPTIKNYLEDDGRSELIEVYRRLNAQWPSLSKAFVYRVELLTVPFCTAVEEDFDLLRRFLRRRHRETWTEYVNATDEEMESWKGG